MIPQIFAWFRLKEGRMESLMSMILEAQGDQGKIACLGAMRIPKIFSKHDENKTFLFLLLNKLPLPLPLSSSNVFVHPYLLIVFEMFIGMPMDRR
jgi:hypothetical protein